MSPKATAKKKEIKPGREVKKKFRKFVTDYQKFAEEEVVYLKKEGLIDVLTYLKNDDQLDFNHLRFVTAVDNYPKDPRFEVVYQLYSISNKHNLRLKVKLEEGQSIKSVVSLWPGANWHERETYDLFGIEFEDHPLGRGDLEFVLRHHFTGAFSLAHIAGGEFPGIAPIGIKGGVDFVGQ